MIKSLGMALVMSFAPNLCSLFKGEPHCRAVTAQATAGEMIYSETELSRLSGHC